MAWPEERLAAEHDVLVVGARQAGGIGEAADLIGEVHEAAVVGGGDAAARELAVQPLADRVSVVAGAAGGLGGGQRAVDQRAVETQAVPDLDVAGVRQQGGVHGGLPRGGVGTRRR